jgi:transketolase C-terminal domain/subunit
MAKLVSMRIAYGQALVELGKANPDVVVLSADVSNSDHSFMFEEASSPTGSSTWASRSRAW